jgi:hypothetical protein
MAALFDMFALLKDPRKRPPEKDHLFFFFLITTNNTNIYNIYMKLKENSV